MVTKVAAAVAQATDQTITVLGDISLADRIAAGRYNGHIHPQITEGNFPHDPKSVGEWEWKIFHFGRNILSKTTVAAMIADGWQPATLEHMLAFGAKYPDVQREGLVIGLGSSCVFGGCRRVSYLCNYAAGRGLGLGRWDGGWGDDYRVLAVCKKV